MKLKKTMKVHQVIWMILSTEGMIPKRAGMIPTTCMVTTAGMLVMMETVIGNTTIKIITIGRSKINCKTKCILNNGMDGTRTIGMDQIEVFNTES